MTVGSYEAKTHFPALLDRVAAGEEIVITRHGVPVAKLVPLTPARNEAALRQAIENIKRLRRGIKLDGLSIRELRDEGRR